MQSPNKSIFRCFLQEVSERVCFFKDPFFQHNGYLVGPPNHLLTQTNNEPFADSDTVLVLTINHAN